MMKKHLITALVLVFLSGTSLFAAPLELKDEQARISYSLGYQIGGDFRQQGVGITPEAVVQGIQDALSANQPLLAEKEMNDLLVSLKKKVVTAQRQEYFQNNQGFMAANLKKEGVKELPGGSQYRVISSGTGASPTLEDTVDIRFNTMNADGTKIASSGGQDTPRTYQINKILPGLRSALLQMKVGDKWEVFVPPGGRNDMLENVGVLIYEVELLAIHPPADK
jgi:FKBP-type peptidyl-prolyl cis-trans isomerase FklB